MSKRIFFLIGTLDIGGAETHLVRVARALKGRGWEPEVFVLSPGGPLTEDLVKADIPVLGGRCNWCRKLPRGKSLTQQFYTMALLIRAMATRQPMIAHFFLPGAYLYGGIVALITRAAPRIMSRRSLNDYQKKHPIYAWIEHRLHRHIDLACGNSRAVVDQLAEEGVPRERLRLIYNGLDLESFPPLSMRAAKRRDLELNDDVLVITIVANLIKYKGHADLINALALIATAMPRPWVLLCLGRDDGIGAGLIRQAQEAGVGENIRWLGSRRDATEIMVASDVGVLCSHEEGFSNAILESMAAGLPMVVTDVGGNAEAVIDGKTGYVVPAKNPHVLGEAILRLVSNPEREEMGKCGRERIRQYFSLDACVDAYERMYEDVQASSVTNK